MADGVSGVIEFLSNLNGFLPDAPICARSTVNRPIRKMRTIFFTTMFLSVLKAKKSYDEINNVNPRISFQARKGKIANVKRQLHSPFSRTRGGVGMEIAVCCCGYNKVHFNNEFPNFIWLNVEKLVVPCKSIAEQVSFEKLKKRILFKTTLHGRALRSTSRSSKDYWLRPCLSC